MSNIGFSTQYGYATRSNSPAAKRIEEAGKRFAREQNNAEARENFRRDRRAEWARRREIIRRSRAEIERRRADLEKLQEYASLGAKERIVVEVAEKHGLKPLDLFKHRRSADIVAARREAMWRCAGETLDSLAAIGRFFGFDHTTVIHNIRTHHKLVSVGDNPRHRD